MLLTRARGSEAGRVRAEGKFLWAANEKLWVRGVAYGAFPPNSQGYQYPESPDVAKDFAQMREAGINTILVYTVPPLSLLDQAEEHGIRVIVTIQWMEYTCFLQDRRTQREIREQIRLGVAGCEQHPAVLMYSVGKEIPPDIIRWQGRKKVESFLRDLCHEVKDEDPGSLVTYTSYPSTEYLELPFVDVFTFNVYLHERKDLCAYLSRLQHLAGEVPFVLTEFGMCSFRNGQREQAALLDWQVEEFFDHGAAGAVVFAWTDHFYTDWRVVEDWGFGIVDAERNPKPAYEAVQRRFTANVPFPTTRRWPKISVVVATYNAAQTLDECLSSLQRLRYPNYEVIVVNDGSTDGSGAIVARYPFRIISTPNQGLSAARNEGLRVATGEIVAYIDSDARADADWLSYLATTFEESDLVGVGGPNPVPTDDSWLAKCVYRAPGGPTHVMLDDRLAEHIPGCNMAFRKWALDEIGGFDPIFTKAGDDVDICWRLLERGYRIGFSPSATVWHHRRASVRAYWRQQVGYGQGEALLERKHPNKFHPWGHAFWTGRIYAPYRLLRWLQRPVIYHGLWGSAGFQSMYQPSGESFFAVLPRSTGFYLTIAGTIVLGAFLPWSLAFTCLALAYLGGYCVTRAVQTKVDDILDPGSSTTMDRFRCRGAIAVLNFLEPLARHWGRLKGGLTPWRRVLTEDGNSARASAWWQRLQPFKRRVEWVYRDTPAAMDKYAVLDRLSRRLGDRGCAVAWNPDSEDWDVRARRGALGEAQVRMVVELWAGQSRQSVSITPARSVYWALGILAAACASLDALGLYVPLAVMTLLLAALWIAPITEANRLEAVILTASAEALAEVGAPADEAGSA
jgi:O-antigen biosynthesis protein